MCQKKVDTTTQASSHEIYTVQILMLFHLFIVRIKNYLSFNLISLISLFFVKVLTSLLFYGNIITTEAIWRHTQEAEEAPLLRE